MSGLTYSLRQIGGPQIERVMASLEARFADRTPLMATMSGYLRDSVRQRFEDQEAPDGSKWQESKAARDRGGQTLLDHGILRDSFNDAHGADFAQVGTADVRAAGFQFGRMKPEPVAAHTRLVRQVFGRRLGFPVYQSVRAHTRNPNIVARPMLGLSAADSAELAALVDDYVTGALA
jgi:phage virion morphogenesis protein